MHLACPAFVHVAARPGIFFNPTVMWNQGDDACILSSVAPFPALTILLQFELDQLSPTERCCSHALYIMLQYLLPADALVGWDTLRAQGLAIPAVLALQPHLLDQAAHSVDCLFTPSLPALQQPSLTNPTCADPLCTIVAQNVQGSHCHAASTHQIAQELSPDFFISCENKTHPSCHRSAWLRRILPNHHTFYSSYDAKGHHPQAGVSVSYHKALNDRCLIEVQASPTHLQGYLSHVRITIPHGIPRHFLGIYQPPSPHQRRTKVAAQLQSYLQLMRTRFVGDRFLVGGDFNAVLAPADRHTGVPLPTDASLQRLLTACDLTCVFSKCAARPPHTFYRQGGSARLDYFLCGTDDPLLDAVASTPQNFVHESLHAHHSDHLPVYFRVPYSALFAAPLPSPPTPLQRLLPARPQLARPFPAPALAAFSSKVSENYGSQAHVVSQRIVNALRAGSVPSGLGGDLTRAAIACISASCEEAWACLPTTPIRARPSTRPPQQGGFLSRSLAKQYKKHLHIVVVCRKLLRHVAQYHKGTLQLAGLQAIHDHLITDACAPLQDLPTPSSAVIAVYRAATTALLHSHQALLRVVLQQHFTAFSKRQERQFAEQWAKSPKRATKLLFDTANNTGTPQQAMPALVHPTKGLVCAPADILESVAFYHRRMQSPNVEPHAAAAVPWDAPTSPDRMTLQQRGTPAGSLEPRLHEHALRSCLAGLTNNTSPGTDGVPNEVLKHLPHELHMLILHLFQLNWRRRCTPQSWQHSNTLLFLKRTPSTDNANYRPIAIHQTLFKLWTRFVTHVLQEYTEEYGILTPSQEGNRPRRGTRHALQYLTLILEDARLHRKDLFTTDIDWKSAFNSIDHRRLFTVMEQLGFPADAIAVVRGIYTGATTSIITPHGTTSPLLIRRGAIQGDTLSPLLFLIMLEPLLRWLEHGGGRHGYSIACLASTDGAPPIHPQHEHGAAVAFADDSRLLAGDKDSMQVQLHKVALYGAWCGMQPNASKCKVSAILHSTGPRNGQSATDATLITETLHGLHINGTMVPVLQPTEPFKYLGVLITLDLNWKPQAEAALQSVRAKCNILARTKAPHNLKLLIDRQQILGSIIHTFCVAPYTLGQLEQMDTVRAGLIKGLFKLRPHFPTAACFATKDNFGIGTDTVVPLYVQAVTEHLIMILNDSGRLGTLGRALLDAHLKRRPQPAAAPPTQPGPSYDGDVGMLGNLLSRPPPLPAQPALLARPPPLAEDSPPTVTMGHNMHTMLGRMLALCHDYHFTTKLNLQATHHQLLQPDLWESITDANRTLNRGATNTMLLAGIAAPLWQVGVYELHDVMLPDGVGVMPWGPFHREYPASAAPQQQALHLLTWLFCATPGRANPTTPAPVPFLFRPQHNATVPPTAAHRRVDRILERRDHPHCSRIEHLVSWQPDTGISAAALSGLVDSLQHQYPARRHPVAHWSPHQPPSDSGDLFDVHWHPTWERDDWLGRHPTVHAWEADLLPNITEALDSALAHMLVTGALPGVDPAQPIDTKGMVPAPLLPPTATRRLLISTEEVNPDVDILPLLHPLVIADSGKAYCYSADGHCCGALSEPHLRQLFCDFQSTSPTPAPIAAFHAPTTALAKRYFTRYATNEPAKSVQCNAPVLPTTLVQHLQLVCSSLVQWHTTPLLRYPTLPHYTSPHPADSVFGSCAVDWAHMFTGSGLVAPWQYTFAGSGKVARQATEDLAARTLKWAILTAQRPEPAFNVVALPCPPSHGLNRFLTHRRVHTLCTIPRDRLQITRALPNGATSLATSKYDVAILLVGNPAGCQQYLRTEHLSLLRSTFHSAYGVHCSLNVQTWVDAMHPLASLTVPLTPSQLFKHAATLPSLPPRQGPSSLDIVTGCTGQRQLRFANTPLTFTDGSKLDTGGLGSGWFKSATGESHSIKPSGHDLQLHTVLRGELIAILSALRASTGPSTTMLIDSLTAIFLIAIAIHQPERLRRSKHRALLTDIAQQLLAQVCAMQHTVSIYKVRAHIGVAGNEAADAAAKLAAEFDDRGDGAREEAANLGVTIFDDPRHATPHLGANWVQRVLFSCGPVGEPPTVTHQNVDTLKAQVKVQAVRVYQNRIFSRNTGGSVVLRRLRGLQRTAAGIQKESIRAIWSKRFSRKQRTAALKIRFSSGILKHTTCSLCTAHRRDSVVHSLGGCLHADTHAMICARHGRSVHAIAECLRDAVNCPVMEDAEGHTRTPRLPAWLIPAGCQPTKPDVVAVSGLTPESVAHADPNTSKVVVHILEWFHTYAGRLLERQQEKAVAHGGVAKRIQNKWKRAKLTVKASGVSHCGLLPGDFITTMQAMGVPVGQAKALVTALAHNAVISNMRILGMRAACRRQVPPPPGLAHMHPHAPPPGPPPPPPPAQPHPSAPAASALRSPPPQCAAPTPATPAPPVAPPPVASALAPRSAPACPDRAHVQPCRANPSKKRPLDHDLPCRQPPPNKRPRRSHTMDHGLPPPPPPQARTAVIGRGGPRPTFQPP